MAIRVDAVLGADVGGYISGMARASQASQTFANNARSSLSGASGGFRELQATVKGIEGTLNRLRSNATRAFAAVGAAHVLPSIFSAAKTALIDFNQSLDQSKIAFTTFMGSADKANKMLAELQTFAAKTPFNFKDLLGTTQQMIAMGTAAEDLIPRLTAIGDAAAALGGSPDVMRRIQRALGQIQAKGRVQAEELMQLAEVGIPAYEYIARTLGVTIPQALKMMEQGQVGAAQAITGLLDGMGESFGGMMDKHSQTMMGALSTVQDYVQMTVANMSRPLFEAVRDMMRTVANYLGSEEMAKKAEDFATSVRNAFTQAGEIAVRIWKEVQPTIQAVYETVVSLGKMLASGWKAAQPVLVAVVGSVIMVGKVLTPVISGIGELAKKLSESKVAGMAVATGLLVKFTPLGGIIKKISEDVTRLTAQRATGDVFKVAFQGQQALGAGAVETAGKMDQLSTAMGTQGMAVKQLDSGLLVAGRNIDDLGPRMTKMGALGQVAMNGLSAGAIRMKATFTAVMTSMKASMIAFAATIPLVLAITAVTTAISSFGKKQREAKERTKELTSAIKSQIDQIFASKEAFIEFRDSGRTAVDLVTDAIRNMGGEVGESLTGSMARLGRQINAQNLVDLAGDFQTTATEMLVLQGVSEDVAAAMAKQIDNTDDNSFSHLTMGDAVYTLTEREKALAAALENTQDQLEGDALFNALLAQSEAAIATGKLTDEEVRLANELAATQEGFASMSAEQQQLIVLQELLNASTAKYNAELEHQAKLEDIKRMHEQANASRMLSNDVSNLNEQYDLLAKGQTDGKLSLEEFSAAVFGSADATGNWTRAMQAADKEVQSIVEGLADAEGSSDALSDAGWGLEQQLRQVYFTGRQMGKEVPVIAQEMQKLVGQFVAGAGEAEYTDEAIQLLLNSMVSLERFGSIGINLYTNADEVIAEIELVAEALARLALVGGTTPQLAQRLRDLQDILDEFRRRGTGGGRGGGGGTPDDSLEGLADYAKSVEDWLAKFFERDFAKNLIERSGEDIADAITDLLDEGFKLAIDQLPYATEALAEIGSLVEQLIGNEAQLRGVGGLNDQLAELDGTIRKLDGDIKSMTERFKEFQRVEQGIGEATTQQRLDEQLQVFRQLKSELSNLTDEYERFKTGGKTALGEQLSILTDLENTAKSLEDQLLGIYKRVFGPSEFEQQTQALYDLADAFENLKAKRQDYATTTAESLSSFEIGKRGGALFAARRYLAKVEAFRDIVAGLRDRAFPAEMIREVIGAGIDGGTMIGRKLLALSATDLAEFQRIQAEITNIAAETGAIAADVLFTADVKDAEQAFNRQMGLVEAMYQQAIAQARNEFANQQAIVDAMYQAQIEEASKALELQKLVVQGLFEQALEEMKAELDAANKKRETLVTAIDDLRATMLNLANQIADLVKQLIEGTYRPKETGGGGATGGGVSGVPNPSNPTGGFPGDVARGGGRYEQTPLGNYYMPPGGDYGFVHETFAGPIVEYIDGTFQMLPIGARAKGGPVLPDMPYMVGELGPELFVPSSAGTIIPNDAMVGSSTKNYTINVNVAGGQNIGREVVRAIEEYERRNGKGWRS